MDPTDPIRQAIAALEGQRARLGDEVVDAALAPLIERLAQAVTSAEPVLRQVSVLFLDVVGSTTLSQHLDPEEISSVMDGALARCTEVVLTQGGKVLQYAGDSLLAAFGADEAREDDAERAVRAGLALLELGRKLGEEVRARHGHEGFDVRVGIHTGGVLLGGGVDQDGTIRGITVNIAARMEQTVPAGGLRISHDTYQQVRGQFDVVAQAPLLVKGVDRPITSYLVQRAKPRAFHLGRRGHGGSPTPLIGRGPELSMLKTAMTAAIEDRRPQRRLLLAHAGIGKSRLIEELLHAVELHPQPCWLLLGRCHPSSGLEPYGLLRSLLTWRLGIADNDSAELARRKLVDGLTPMLMAAGIEGEAATLDALCLGHLIGFDHATEPALTEILAQPQRLRERALASVARSLQGMVATDGSPIVMLLEDLHWADDASLDWLHDVLSSPPPLPLLLVMSARPGLLERRPDWAGAIGNDGVLTLAPLDSSQRMVLTAALLRRLPQPPAELLAFIDHQAEGNPFFAEEVVQMLRDQCVIVDDEHQPGAWRLVPDRLRLDRLPVTLTGVLQARLDELEPEQRHALQMASVIGPVFWDDAVAALAPQAPQSMDPLQRKALVTRRPQSRFDDTPERAFHHHLLHQVTYDTVLKSARREGHARAAVWLQARAGDRSDEVLAITADHYERAGDHERAFEWFARASQRARQRDAGLAALSYCQRALALPPPSDPRARIVVIVRQADLCDLLGRYGEMGQLLDQAFVETQAIGADDLLLSVISSQMLLADRLGDEERGWTLAQDLAAAAEQADNSMRAALAWGNLAWISKERGQFELASEQVARAMVWARKDSERTANQADSGLYEVQLLQVEAAIHDAAFDDDRCEQSLLESLRRADRHKLGGRARANAHVHLAQVALRRFDLEAAAVHLATAERIAEAIPVRRTVLTCQREQARLSYLAGQPESALPRAEAAAEAFFQLQIADDDGHCRLIVAEAHRDAGQFEAMAQACRLALARFEIDGHVEGALCARLLLARAQQGLGDTAAARSAVRADRDRILETGAMNSVPQALAALWAAWQVLQVHEDEDADRLLAVIQAELERRVQRSRDPVTRARVRAWPLHRDITAAWLAQPTLASPSPGDPAP